MSLINQLLWAIIGLLLTIIATFLEAFIIWPGDYNLSTGLLITSLGVTYQIGAVLLTGCVGGKGAGAVSQIAYLIIGLYWLPVFAKGGGFEYFKEPSFGYLLGFIPGAWLSGFLAFRTKLNIECLFVSSLSGLSIIHLVGITYLFILFPRFPDFLLMVQQYSLNSLPGHLAIVCLVAVIAFLLRSFLA